MIIRRRKKSHDLDHAYQQLQEAREKKKEVESHEPVVQELAREANPVLKGNGFYNLFKQAVKGS